MPALQAEWSSPDLSKVSPKRSGHTAFSTAKDRQFLFGGYIEEEDSPDAQQRRSVTNDLWEWQDGTGWIPLAPQGDLPGARLVAAGSHIRDQLYLFGGWDPQDKGDGGVILETVHKFDTVSGQWTQLDATVPGGPTSRLVAVSLPSDKILLHNHRCVDHVLLFDGGTFTQQPVSGYPPSSRGLHAACVLPNGNVVLFGGADKSGTMSNEIFLLDTDTWSWTNIQSSEQNCPSPRAGASLCSFDNHCVILFGGAEVSGGGLNPKGDVWAIHLDSGNWELLWEGTNNEGPPPRNAATLSFLRGNGDGSKEFVLTGGWAPFRETWDDCFVLKISRAE